MVHCLLVLVLVWVLRWFGTADDLVRFLNTLPSAQQADAKVISAPSQRSPLGWFDQPYGLLYREEAR